MPSLQTLLAFFGVAVLLALSPGPDNLFVLVQSAQRGWRLGLAVVAGLCCGLVAQTAAVALGLAALFLASATAFMALKLVGAAYLAYLAWGAFRARAEAADVPLPGTRPRVLAPGEMLRMVGRGFIMNITNPKVLVFFLAFLPQFTDAARGSIALQICIFGGVFILATLLVFGGIACFSGTFGNAIRRSPRVQVWLNRLAGTVFLVLALDLLVVRR